MKRVSGAGISRISELDPGDGCWPFADTVLVVGPLPADKLRAIVGELQADEAGPADGFAVPPAITERHNSPVSVIWWD